jgi:hypothetical protein
VSENAPEAARESAPAPRPPLAGRLLARVAALLLRILGATWRVDRSGEDPRGLREPYVGVMWHRNLLVAAWDYRDSQACVPASRSRDGELVAALLRALGYGPSPRGSSSRGASAMLRGLVRLAREGHIVGVLADGPRGPARQAKPGAVALARMAGRPLRAVGYSARPALRFGSWDRAFLPAPFARVVCRYGPPLRVPKSAGEPELARLHDELQRSVDAISAEADAVLGLPAEPRDGPRRA